MDIVEVALNARVAKKGELTEAEAKKLSITVPKPLKLTFKSNEFVVDMLIKKNDSTLKSKISSVIKQQLKVEETKV